MTLDKLLELVYTSGYSDGYEDGELQTRDTFGHIEWSFQSFLDEFKSSEAYLSVSKQIP